MITNSLQPCLHLEQIEYNKFKNCLQCGIALTTNEVIKSNKFNSCAEVSPAQLYSNMINEQSHCRFYNPSASYIKYRGILVKWLRNLNNQFHLSRSNFHIAVMYMDYTLSRYNFTKYKYDLIALTCLLLAAKYDELDRNIPALNDLIDIAKSKIPSVKANEIKQCEAYILKLFEWDLKVVTPLLFVELLLTQGVLCSTDEVPENFLIKEKAKSISDFSIELIDKALDCIYFY